MRIGHGWDTHRLVEGRPFILGGILLTSPVGPKGHSDGDALLHALTDAVLGAAALGDIGTHFPDTDPKWRGAESGQFLQAAVAMAAHGGWQVVNADATVILEHPKMGPYRGAIVTRVADLLGVAESAVNLKAKTAEGLGPAGEGRAVECHAVVLLSKADVVG